MQLLTSLDTAAYQDLIDYNVVDVHGEHIGTLHSLWSDQETGRIEFLGVKTGWLFGKNHVVPVSEAQVDASGKSVKLPYPAEFIKHAPSMDADSEIIEAQEQQIYSYYRNFAATSAAGSGSTGASSSDMERAPGGTGTVGRLRRTSGSFGASSSGGVGSGMMTSETDLHGNARTTEAAAVRSADSHVNPDPLTGEPGAHPIGTGIGAASGAATGAAMGAVGGPVGAMVGGVAGAVVGGLIGKGVEEYFDPTVESAYWRANYNRASYYDPAQSFEDLEPAYRAGYEGFGRLAREGRTGEFHTVETDLQRDYDRARSSAGLAWEKARHATRDAYERMRAKVGSRSDTSTGNRP